ncbi:MAG: hypothetical protein ACLVJ6_05640 [Merdibacter sp.]
MTGRSPAGSGTLFPHQQTDRDRRAEAAGEKGYLHYEPSGKDLRYKQIVLDDKAYQCAKQLHARFEAMERKLYQGLSDEELELTRSLLLRLLDNISKEEEVVQ